MKQKLTHSDILTIARRDYTESWATATKILLRLYGGQKKPAQKKTFWGKNTTGNLGRNHGPNSMQLAPHPTRLYSSSKRNFKTKKETWYHQRSTVGSEGLDGHHVLYSLLYTTASLPMILAPKAQALSYHVPTIYLFLPNSQAQSLEIPFYIGKTKRRLHDRKTEHFKALLKNDHSSAIADHVKNTGHNIKGTILAFWHLARLTSIVRLKRPYLFESCNQH